eukprot:TRINITY_DN197_c0_g1_i2.p1 TRINITY_DN197_c0_g1~~TRINITY_DN197_c0_g1_i2.p1  ORF type:complete len:2316 (+),score=1293.97 TRINITY_DN197_c0_g1_i2:197-7144(+)
MNAKLSAVATFLVVLSLFSLSEAVGTVVLDKISPTKDQPINFMNDVYSPDALMGTINTGAFHVLKQYELNIPVPVVVLNGKAQGLTLGGSLGAQIVSKEGSVSFFGGNNTFINAGGFDAAAALSATLQSSQGNVDVSSQFSLEFISGGNTFTAGNNLNLDADGDVEFFSRNDLGLLSNDQLTLTFPKTISLQTSRGEIDFSAGGLLQVSSQSSTQYRGLQGLYITSNGPVTGTANAGSFQLKGVEINVQTNEDVSLTASNAINLSGASDITLGGQSASFLGSSVSLSGDGPYSTVEIKGNGNGLIDSGLGSTTFTSGGTKGTVTVRASTSGTLSAGNLNSLSASDLLQLGIRDVTKNIKLTSAQSSILLQANKDFHGYADTSFDVSSTGVNTLSAIDNIEITSHKGAYTAGNILSFEKPSTLTFQSDLERFITFSSATDTTLVSTSDITVSTSGYVGTVARDWIITAQNLFSLTSGDGRDLSVAAGTTQTFSSTTATSINAFQAFFRGASFDLTSRTTVSFSAENFDLNAFNTFYTSKTADISISGGNSILELSAGGNANIVATSTISSVSTTDEFYFDAANKLSLTSGDDLLFTSNADTTIRTDGVLSLTASGAFAINVDNGPTLFQASDILVKSKTISVTANDPSDVLFDVGSFYTESAKDTKFDSTSTDINFNAGLDLIIQSLTDDISFFFDNSFSAFTETDARFKSTATDIIFTANNDFNIASQGNNIFTAKGDITYNGGQYAIESNGNTIFNGKTATFTSTTGLSVLANDGEIEIESRGSITNTAGTDISIITQTGDARQASIAFSAANVNIASTTAALTLTTPDIATFEAPTITVAASSATISSATDTTIAAKDTSSVKTGPATFSGPSSVKIGSGTDQYISSTVGTLTINSEIDSTLFGASNAHVSAKNGITLTSETTSIEGNERLSGYSKGASLFSSLSDLDGSITVQSSGGAYFTSDNQLPITITSVNHEINLSAGILNSGDALGNQGSILIEARDEAFGCIVNVVSESDQTHQAGGELIFNSQYSCVEVQALDTITVNANNNAFIETDAQAALFVSNGFGSKDIDLGISVNTQNQFGNIEVQAVDSSLYLLSNQNTAVISRDNSYVEGTNGVIVESNLPSAPVVLTSSTMTDFFGDNGVSIGAGSPSQLSEPAFSIVSTTGIEVLARDSLSFTSYGALNAPGIAAINFAGDIVTVQTRSGYNVDFIASGSMSFSAVGGNSAFTTTNGDLTIDAELGDIKSTSLSVTAIASGAGPVNVNAAGGNSPATSGINFTAVTATNIKSNLADIDVTANKLSSFSANSVLFAVQQGCQVFQTKRFGDDITVNAETITSTFNNNEFFGNNIDIESPNGDVQITFNGEELAIGKTTSPIVRIQSGGEAGVSDGINIATSAGDIVFNSNSTLSYTVSGNTTFTAGGRFDIESAGLISIKAEGAANSGTGTDFTVTTQNLGVVDIRALELTVAVPAFVDVKAFGKLTLETAFTNNKAALEIITNADINYNGDSLRQSATDTFQLLSDDTINMVAAESVSLQNALATDDAEYGYFEILPDSTFVGTSLLSFAINTFTEYAPITFTTNSDDDAAAGGLKSDITVGTIANLFDNIKIGAGADLELQSTESTYTAELDVIIGTNNPYTLIQSTGGVTPGGVTIDAQNVVTFKSSFFLETYFEANAAFDAPAGTIAISSALDTVNINSPTTDFKSGTISTFAQDAEFTIESITSSFTNIVGDVEITDLAYVDFYSANAMEINAQADFGLTASNKVSLSTDARSNIIFGGATPILVSADHILFESNSGNGFYATGNIEIDASSTVDILSDYSIELRAANGLTINSVTNINFNAKGSESTDGYGLGYTSNDSTFTVTDSALFNILDSYEDSAISLVDFDIATLARFEAHGRDQNIRFEAASNEILVKTPIYSSESGVGNLFSGAGGVSIINNVNVDFTTNSAYSGFLADAASLGGNGNGVLTLGTTANTGSISFTAPNAINVKSTTHKGPADGLIILTSLGAPITASPNVLDIVATSQSVVISTVTTTVTGTTAAGQINYDSFSLTIGKSDAITLAGPAKFNIVTEDGDIDIRSRNTIVTPLVGVPFVIANREPSESSNIGFTSVTSLSFGDTSGVASGVFKSVGNAGTIEVDAEVDVTYSSASGDTTWDAIGGVQIVVGPQAGGVTATIQSTVAGGDVVITASGWDERIEFVSESRIQMVVTAGNHISVTNYYSRLGFFSRVPVIIQRASSQIDTCLYYFVCPLRGANNRNSGNAYCAVLRLNTVLNQLQLALMRYGLLEYKTPLAIPPAFTPPLGFPGGCN